ncbi:hypothetical protein EVB32_127 [Rhizobium phage RHph_TM39]|uniref:Uncharacterized protein n=1 Tax=Rhizobium phage RHph_TM30 TaxID=2509764 RepID=A0A7S5RFS2_9CAUD|nr:hypothetical protein PQC16_gp127 [Rhizobium phage RHph_TM30]QIG71598.1 hypothetical protein EVB94_127 [Rhizobium phage RHph_TM40]QIG71961.1 hypothetical protein EVB95_127 [Rhizobium phage RHph_TM2_3B]QIG72323.1 hypothetical protein EVB96_127 [Rhizobium phage RHph_TM3_3_6]QIG77115.1 hypothetical protein EVB32_127 [Rhizobium phage RHph_TM39]QIG77713.1 hypothetical protein EVB64_126 [Rhizobium phage RHph_TM61]
MIEETHKNHPGVTASECPARITVNAQPSSNHGSGYACSVTGGHCIPSSDCDARRKIWRDHNEVQT